MVEKLVRVPCPDGAGDALLDCPAEPAVPALLDRDTVARHYADTAMAGRACRRNLAELAGLIRRCRQE